MQGLFFKWLFPFLCSFRSNRWVNVNNHFSLWPTNRLLTGGQQVAECWPSVGRQSAKTLAWNMTKTVSRQLANSQPTDSRQYFLGTVLHFYQVNVLSSWEDTLPSQCRSPPRSINGWQQIVREAWWNANEGGEPFDGLASPPGGSSDTPSHFMLHGNWDKLWLGGPIGLSTDLTFIIEIPYMVKVVNCWSMPTIHNKLESHEQKG